MEPIFIIGCQRTGTTMLSNLLNQHSDIDVMSEIHLYEPYWLHKDFVQEVKRQVGDLSEDKKISKLMDLMYSKKMFGVFWQNFNLDRKKIYAKILASDRSIKSIFSILLSENRNENKKKRCGAKFPVHFSYLYILLEWFPKCKIIHMARDVRGIYSSQANKYLIRPGHAEASDRIRKLPIGKKANKFLIRMKMLLFICIQFPWAANVHSTSKHLSNYRLLRYEDLILYPEQSLKSICAFLEIDFKEEMLYPRVINSSFVKAFGTEKGFNKDMVYKWKDYISPITAKLLVLLNNTAMKRFGY